MIFGARRFDVHLKGDSLARIGFLFLGVILEPTNQLAIVVKIEEIPQKDK